MSNRYSGDFEQRPPQDAEPDPALAGYPAHTAGAWYSPIPGYGPAPAYPPEWGYATGLAHPPAPAVPGVGYPYPVRQVGPLPTQPRPYHQMLRGPQFRWWKPIVTSLLALAMSVPLVLLSFIPLLVGGLATASTGLDTDLFGFDINNLSPLAFVTVNLSLIVLIPLSGLSIWIVHRIRPRYLSSVAGGIRWRWLARCVFLVLPIWLLYLALGLLVDRPGTPRPDQWLTLLIIVVLMTPLQAAAEEYFFRGWIMQNVGAWFARPVLGLVVSVAVSAAIFSAAHGSADPWIVGAISCLAVASGIAAWRTGGLEAGIAMHAVNNVLAFGVVLLFGGWEEAFIGTDTKGAPAVLILALLVHGGALALILWQARRIGLQTVYRPAPIQPLMG
jgi:membrane protease YdiL (CAAX protease family)